MYSTIAERIIYPLGDIALGTHIMRDWRELEKTQWWNPPQLKELQERRLQALIEHVYNNVAFYRTRFDQLKLKPADIRTTEDLQKIPILTKEDVKNNFPDGLVAQNIGRKKIQLGMTGGSTGRPLQFYRFVDSTSRDWAAALRAWGWAGYRPGDKLATLWGHPLTLQKQRTLPQRLQNVLRRNLLLSAYEMDETALMRYTDSLEKYKPKFIRGYTSAVFLLAKYLKKNHITAIKPRAVFTTSEALFDFQRELIERQFDCKVFDHYGSGEVHSVAFECEEHSGHHITAENVIVELIKADGTPVRPGEQGELVLTDLNNYATPFIRYNIEDVGTPSGETCKCGRGLPVLSALEGRSSEILEMPNGRFVFIGYWVVLFETVAGVDQYQVVQESPTSLLVRIVKNARFSDDDLAHITENIRKLGGDELELKLEFVSSIPPSPSGKRRFVISKVEQEPLGPR
jgi:phenylacetate-CoA ligase